MKATGLLLVIAILITLLVSACTSVPVQFKGDFPALKPRDTGTEMLDTRVRWGGVILETRPEAEHTCFEILSRQLETSMRPADTDQSDGRFIACKPGFYDPEVFKKEREVTLTGKIIHIDSRRVGEYDYRFPVVDIEFFALWPKRRDPVYIYGSYRPYYWHYPHYGIYWRYPY